MGSWNFGPNVVTAQQKKKKIPPKKHKQKKTQRLLYLTFDVMRSESAAADGSVLRFCLSVDESEPTGREKENADWLKPV